MLEKKKLQIQLVLKANYNMNIFNNYFDRSLRKIADNFLIKNKKGNLIVNYPNGDKREFIGKKSGYKADIKFNNYKLFSKLLLKGSTGFAESYMDGDFETSNLSKLLLFSYENESVYIENKKTVSIIDAFDS